VLICFEQRKSWQHLVNPLPAIVFPHSLLLAANSIEQDFNNNNNNNNNTQHNQTKPNQTFGMGKYKLLPFDVLMCELQEMM
jgi:hypothetical protein